MNYTPNLISFNPKVCIFKYDDGTLNQVDINNVYVPQYTKSMLSAFAVLGKNTTTTPKSDLGTVSISTIKKSEAPFSQNNKQEKQ